MKELGQAILAFAIFAAVAIMFVLTFKQVCSQLEPTDYKDNKLPVTCIGPMRPPETP